MKSFVSRCQAATLWTKGGAILLALICSAVSAKADYRLDVGDVLEISVAGVPDVRQRVVVQLDGSISYPMLGSFVVAGLSPAEARAKIRAILSTKVFRQRTPDGRENVVAIEPDQVTANVVDYRPIYVNGDVSKPGEQAYRPLMTVRQAVALSGGYEIMRFRMNHPFLESADLRSEYESLWTEFVKARAQMRRLRSELDGEEHPDDATSSDAPLPSSTISRITRLEAEQLKGRLDDYKREKEFLGGAIKQSNEHINILSQQVQKEEEGLQADAQDLKRTTELFERGAVSILRVADARRASLLSSTRKLQTTAQLMYQMKQRDDLARSLEKLDSQRRIDLLRETQDAGIRLNQIAAKLQSVGEKLQYTALIRSQLVRGAGGKPEITVIRKGPNGRESFHAEEDTELQPGDVVEVALRSEHGVVEVKPSLGALTP